MHMKSRVTAFSGIAIALRTVQKSDKRDTKEVVKDAEQSIQAGRKAE
jgi:hypothetical protein